MFPEAVSNLASEESFYDLPPTASSDAQAVEKTFGEVEGEAAAAIGGLLDEVERNGRFDAKNHKRRAIIATFLALQDTRTRAFRQSYVAMYTQIEAHIKRMHDFARRHHEARGEKVEVQQVDLGIPAQQVAN